jgi:hypothetical protein
MFNIHETKEIVNSDLSKSSRVKSVLIYLSTPKSEVSDLIRIFERFLIPSPPIWNKVAKQVLKKWFPTVQIDDSQPVDLLFGEFEKRRNNRDVWQLKGAIEMLIDLYSEYTK